MVYCLEMFWLLKVENQVACCGVAGEIYDLHPVSEGAA